MKPGTPPPSPDDDASDPLLAALRQRLGNYGQAPPPAAWAAIRQRLPPAPVRPWWRRPRRLLPLLALLLSVVAIGLVAERRGQLVGSAQRRSYRPPVAQPLANRPLFWANSTHKANSAPENDPNTDAPAAAKHISPANAATPPLAATAAPQPKATLSASFSNRPTLAKKGFLGQAAGLGKHTSVTSKAALHSHHSLGSSTPSESAASLAFTAKNRRRSRNYAALGASPAAGRMRGPSRHSGPRSAKFADASQPVLPALPTGTVTTTPVAATTKMRSHPAYATPQKRHAHREYPRASSLATTTPRATSRGPRALAGAPEPAAPGARLTGRAHSALGRSAASLADESLAAAGAPVDSLALGQPVLTLAAGALPAELRATPDSMRPAALPVRRWSVLLVAGPTLSYRTLGPAPALAAGQPDFARLERPALGFGAQVQVRRVLSGRWALAVGLGYHEYATRLALSRKDSGVYNTIRQRDTYRLLTVPVQLSYALAAPRGQLSWALLAGFEPSWYQGGRSTEGSTCNCQQQVYSATAPRPYRSLSLAFSLGLDVRYRLGGTGSRWQWLVQPTGRYVATPFVRSDAVGFTQRQPFSLGLLTGFSWDVR